MKALADFAAFLRQARRHSRSGELSREPLSLLRVEWKGDSVECDWVMRPVDPWDRDLPLHLAKENQTLQALRDALQLRDMIFRCFPAVASAHLRMFRPSQDHQLELVLSGWVSRHDEVLHRVPSIVMRAKMCGLRFTIAEGSLRGMLPAPLGL